RQSEASSTATAISIETISCLFIIRVRHCVYLLSAFVRMYVYSMSMCISCFSGGIRIRYLSCAYSFLQLVLLAIPEPCFKQYSDNDICSGARYCICGLVPNQ
uniref:Uncharacterized protein n=1 Tax=Wuchereria bancrofti TaxID=6293 RepID=A0A1I8ESY5_WUCBA